VSRGPWEFEEPLCAEVGVEIFYTDDKDEKKVESMSTYAMANSICKKCPHKNECAEWAIKHELFGFWGGLSPKERTNLRRDKRMQVSLDLKII
jgi:hypothetical protein